MMKSPDPRDFHVVTCSAHSCTSLIEAKRRMLRHLESNQDINLASLAYTTTARRSHHTYRASYHGNSLGDITQALGADLQCKQQQIPSKHEENPIIFVFAGQSGLYPGMGAHLFATSKQFKNIVTSLENDAMTLGFPSYIQLIAN